MLKLANFTDIIKIAIIKTTFKVFKKSSKS